MKCEYCGCNFSKEELTLDGYCSHCDNIRCGSCGFPSDNLDEYDMCNECGVAWAENYNQCRDDCDV